MMRFRIVVALLLAGLIGSPLWAQDNIDEVIRQANAARDGGNLLQAADLFSKVMEARPYWVEGWWNLGTVLYDSDRFQEATEAFRRLVSLDPENGPAWALLGLNEYQIREYDRSLESLRKALVLGVGNHEQFIYVTRFHAALLLNRMGEFEAAIELLNKICLKHSENPKVIEALGISVLRLPYLPAEVPPDWREPVMLTGRASTYWATNRLEDAAEYYFQLRDRYPNLEGVHYAVGVFYLQYDPPASLGEFEKELEVSPEHVPAHLQIAFEYIRRGEPMNGRPYAEKAVELAPTSFVARNALGRTMLDLGEIEAAIEEFEKGVELEPASPQMYFQLARAYTKAGRREEARQAREQFLKLDTVVRERQAEGTPLVPGMGETSDEGSDPTQ